MAKLSVSSATRHFLADTYLGFVFWTVLTSLGMCIWYFPLWHMGISGYEAALFSDMAPAILGLGCIHGLLRRHRWVAALLGLSGIFAYALSSPAWRLLAVAVGTAGVTLWWAAALHEDAAPTGRMERAAMAWEAGLVASVAVRMWFQTSNPAWATMNALNGGWNRTALVLGLLAVADVATRRPDSAAEAAAAKKGDLRVAAGRVRAAWVPAALGLGALLFALHSLFSDSAIVPRWAWAGYPHTGPAPVPWGALVIGALGCGFALGHRSRLTTSLLWWALGSCGAAAVTLCDGWAGFCGGLVLAVYVASVSRAVLRVQARCPAGRTFAVALLWYNALVLGHVWVVAYEFVPGGPLLRERTWAVMAAMMLALLAGARAAAAGAPAPAPAAFGADRRRHRRALLACVGAGALAMAWRLPAATQAPVPHAAEQRALTVGIWTVHFDLDNDMWLASDRILAAVRDLQVDVMGFLESDTERIIMGGRDWTQRVSEQLGFYVDYGPAPRKHTWGCAMMSKFRIVKSTHHLLPSPEGELACAIHATLDVYGRPVDVVVSHNGQEENALDRRLQTTELARIMRESPNPVVFAGYVVTSPHAENYRILYEQGHIHDVDPTDDDRWCQYIGFRGLKRTGYARVSRGTITDTEIQVAKFVVPPPLLQGGAAAAWAPSYARVSESAYAPELRFPAVFRGEGVRGHFYHVFKEPRYYD
ncbi:Protein cwh43 [Kickxella alabastrina]|uniref:Protein cwh43 n=1 Tax=Kickxella alabastrina TaxID=61397 RepID=A0ACC1ID26_9FUNG|nr:Protein cwh43 [Kickxella alabastrina]